VTEPLTVACVQWGNYEGRGAEYANVLADAVRRHLTAPHRFLCFTDAGSGLDEGIEARALPTGMRGWFNKLWLFAPGVLSGRVLFLDLDTVITDSLDDIAEYRGDFACLRDFYRPDGLGSGVMAWRAESAHDIWTEWERAGRPEPAGGDQSWIERLRPGADRLQDLFPGQIASYKVHCSDLGSPAGSRVICFHGRPRPHEAGGWVDLVWRKNGYRAARFIPGINVPFEQALGQIEANAKRALPWFFQQPAHKGVAVLVGGGPSLAESVGHIRARQKRGQKIFALNGTHDYLIRHKIVPDYMVVLDAREANTCFVAAPHPKVKYLIASMCHPKVLDALDGHDVTLWHAEMDGIVPLLAPYAEEKPIGLIGGGNTVGLKAMCLAHEMGFRRQHLYGFDSSYRAGDNHAYAQALNDGEAVSEVTVAGRTFRAAPWMMNQVRLFQRQARALDALGSDIEVHGDGLLPWTAKHMSHSRKAA